MKLTNEREWRARERWGERPVLPFYSDVRACAICGAIDHDARECLARVANRRALTPAKRRVTVR